jgi:FSR family fosmidomycin resistance protein-like MFS transporter
MTQAVAMEPNKRRTLALICAGHFMSHFWSITLPALFTVLSTVFGVNFVQLGLLMTVYSIANAVFQIPCGFIVDHYGPKWILVAGIMLDGAAFAACAIAPNYVTLLVLMLIAGAGQAVFHPADYAVLSALFPKERAGKTYAVHTFMGFSGGAAAPIIVAGMASIFNWQISLLVTGLIGIAIGLVIASLMHAPELEAAVPSASVTAERQPAGQLLAGAGYMLSRTLLLLFGFFVFTSMFLSGIRSFLPSTLTALFDMSNGTANAMLTAFMAALAVGVLVGGVFADRTANQARLIAACLLAGTVFMVLIALFHMPIWILFLMLIAAGLVQGAISPSRDKMVREAAPEGSAGKSFAFVSVGLSVGGIVAPLLLGALLDQGEATLVFWVLAAFSIVAMLMVLLSGGSTPGSIAGISSRLLGAVSAPDVSGATTQRR